MDDAHVRERITRWIQESKELFDFVTAATSPDEVFVFGRPRALALMTGRKASAADSAMTCGRSWRTGT